MSIKSILCAYSGDPNQGSGLRHAIRLAKRHGASLTAVAKTGGLGFLHRQYSAQLPQNILDQLDANGRQVLSGIAARFGEVTKDAGLSEQAEFVELDPKVDGPIASFARAFDLIVIGHHMGAPYEDDYGAHPDLIALRSGRPVLVVPQGYEGPDATKAKALVAWDGKRAATRALVAAMPILEDGADVTLMTVGQTPHNTAQLVKTVARHGLNVNAVSVAQSGSTAATILDQAERQSVDLVVMGAFEHSKFSHDLIGGVTTQVLEQAKVPILMAH